MVVDYIAMVPPDMPPLCGAAQTQPTLMLKLLFFVGAIVQMILDPCLSSMSLHSEYVFPHYYFLKKINL